MTTETTYQRDELKAGLIDGLYFIEFTKRDGTLRRMLCTRMWDFIPESAYPDPQKSPERKQNENVLPVWSLPDQGWRSFRLDSIKSVVRVERYKEITDAVLAMGHLPDVQQNLMEHFTNRN